MDFKSIIGKFVKGAASGAIAAYGAMAVTGGLNNQTFKGLAFALVSGAIHGGWEAAKQAKA